jgi:hypothetical protein
MSAFLIFAIAVVGLLAVWIGRAAYRVSRPDYVPPVQFERNASRSFYTKVAGVTKENPDGERRQKIIKELEAGERVILVREPDNKFDPNAIRVDSGFGQIGYIPADTAANNLASLMDRGHKVKAEISEITGGVAGKRTRGVNLQISVFDPIPQQKRAA